MNDFESMLQIKMDNQERVAKKITVNYNATKKPLQKADKSATLFDFIEMIDRLITLTMPDVKFVPDEGKVYEMDAMKNIDQPIITYKLLERSSKTELKPRVRETVIADDKINDSEIGEVWGQKFRCDIQFNIIASVYKDAEEVMERFEELITMYTGFFKKNGVAELLFKKQYTDDYYARLRETLSIRNLVYYVEIEKLTVIFKEKIQEIEILAQNKKEEI